VEVALRQMQLRQHLPAPISNGGSKAILGFHHAGHGIMPGSFVFWNTRYSCAMKHLFLGMVICALALTACDDKSKGTAKMSGTNTTADSTSPLDAPGGYLKAVVKSQQNAVKTIDTTSLDKAIQMFNVEQGRNPKELNELVEKKYIPQIPTPPFGTKIVYDASAGTVKVQKE